MLPSKTTLYVCGDPRHPHVSNIIRPHAKGGPACFFCPAKVIVFELMRVAGHE